ncbi:hypothetical protein SHXM_03602 [Streptomyces hygroscopicus]|nr:hypothetical protein SHXM_03602 [Streptomyces hygroscopicus]
MCADVRPVIRRVGVPIATSLPVWVFTAAAVGSSAPAVQGRGPATRRSRISIPREGAGRGGEGKDPPDNPAGRRLGGHGATSGRRATGGAGVGAGTRRHERASGARVFHTSRAPGAPQERCERYARAIGASTASVSDARSPGASSTSSPRRPAETQIVS